MGWAVGLVIVTGYIIRLITAVGYMMSDYGRSISQCFQSEKNVGKEVRSNLFQFTAFAICQK